MLATALAVAFSACGERERRDSAEPTPETAPPSVTPPAPMVDSRPLVAAFGDSLTAGFGLDAGKSYPDDLQKLIDAAGYKYRVVNMGVSGDTTTDGVERLPSVLALKPSVAILEFGANDGLRGQPVDSSRANMRRMIEALQRADVAVVLAGMTLPRNYGPDYIRTFEQMYVDLGARYKLVRIPFLLEGVGGIARLTQQDGLHPTAEGADIMAHTVFKWLRPLLRKQV